MPLAAFKGLARIALSILPERELPYFEDAVEWVSNPDHACDANTFGELRCYVHRAPRSSSASWAAVARRVDDDAPMPYMLAFVGSAGVTFQIAVPLCARDDDLDGEGVIVPRVADPVSVAQGDPQATCAVVRLSAVESRRDVALEPVSEPVSIGSRRGA